MQKILQENFDFLKDKSCIQYKDKEEIEFNKKIEKKNESLNKIDIFL